MIAIVFAFLIVVLTLTKPKDFPPGQPRTAILITVTNGESGTAIARDLAAKSVVLKASTLIAKIIASSSAVGIAPGIHRIDTHIPSELAITELLDQKRIVDLINVLPGSTEADVRKQLRKAKSISQSDSSGPYNLVFGNKSGSLEGQIAPGQYSFPPGTSIKSALTNMEQHFYAEILGTNLRSGYINFTPYQVLTIASLIQIEADPQDYGKAARVIYNRLRIGMPLQLNSTVAYAQGLRGQIGLSIAATKIASPYNTYLNVGLPPTPISNPSLNAITGALNPMAGNWLYFITVKPHDTRFTSDFTIFEKWVTVYNQNVKVGLFK